MPKKSLDVILLFTLILARIRIDTLADSVLPQRHADVFALVSGWWPLDSLERLAHPETDPVSMMLIVTALGLFGGYLLLDALAGITRRLSEKRVYQLKMGLVYAIIILLVFGKAILLINLRQIRGPASYTHDGGVIQTEATIQYFLDGLNPYVEDYTQTPMAEWGFNEYRTALYHYPYLPWTFVFSTPFFQASYALLGWYDQRFVYLFLFAITLALAQNLVKKRSHKLLMVMLLGLNPILAVDVIFGQNDSFVLFWLVLGVWLAQQAERRPAGSTAQRNRWWLASAAVGLACATKPTAWFIAPFWLLYAARSTWGQSFLPPVKQWPAIIRQMLYRAGPALITSLSLLLPWLIWNPGAMYDDVWRWSSGQGETGYQIWGWGASNYVLGLGWVSGRFEYWPFIIPQAIVSLPLLGFLLWRQVRYNRLSSLVWHYALFLYVFFFLSRFMQANYLGYLLAFLTIAYFVEDPTDEFLG